MSTIHMPKWQIRVTETAKEIAEIVYEAGLRRVPFVEVHAANDGASILIKHENVLWIEDTPAPAGDAA